MTPCSVCNGESDLSPICAVRSSRVSNRKGTFMSAIPAELIKKRVGLSVILVGFLGAALLAKDSAKPAHPSARLQRVEQIAVELPGDRADEPLRLSLPELMKAFNVPGLSIAVIENYKIVDVKAYGVIAPGSSTPVTTHTLFQAGSISKPVAATGALYLVEHGKLILDQDVNEKLKSWKVPQNEFTQTEK